MRTQLQKIKFIVFLLISTISFAQQGINYQGVARDAGGQLIEDTEINLKFNVNVSVPDGDTVYSETHAISTDVNGVFSVVIGEGTPVLNIIEDINWAEDKHYLNVWLNNEEIGTTEFMSVPYSKAIGKWQAHKNGMAPKGTGGSIYIGEDAGESDDFTDNHNIGLGLNTLQMTSVGANNVAIGSSSLHQNRTGNLNVAIGVNALEGNVTGDANIAIGNNALKLNTSSQFNIALGSGALKTTTGHFNIGIGSYSLNNNTTGNHNIAMGDSALGGDNVGDNNISIGRESMFSNTEGSNNLALGQEALRSNTSGNYNVANGFQALMSNTSGANNIAIGQNTLNENTDGEDNIAIGQNALLKSENGFGKVAIGRDALEQNRMNYNVGIGLLSQTASVTGENNVSLGAFALSNSISGDFNVAIGHSAGSDNLGSGNVFIGNESGRYETGSNKLYITNQNGNYNGHFPLIYGEFDNSVLGFRAEVGIGTKAPQAPLHVLTDEDVSLGFGTGSVIIGNAAAANLALDSNEIQARNGGIASSLYLQQNGGNVYVGNAIVHASDKRLKRDIANISYGLQDILKLRPTEYFWKGRVQENKSLGLIAQEVEEVIKNVVTYDREQDKYGVSYTELIPVLIKALQEQQNIIDNQNSTIIDFENRLSALEKNLMSN